jgi:hypothetical protein
MRIVMKTGLSVLCALVAAMLPGIATASAIREQDLRPHIEILASDAYEGREPGTEGERKTLAYLKKTWIKAGLKPGGRNGEWLEPVYLVRRGPIELKAAFFAKGERLRVSSEGLVLIGREASYQSRQLPLQFAGYGVDKDGKAPADVAGKAVFILADQADFLPAALRSLRSRREILINAGAESVIAVAGEQVDFQVFRRALLARPIALQSADPRAQLEGIASPQFMVALVTAAGGDWDKLRTAARDPGFGSKSLGVTADLDVASDVYKFASYNIVGKIPGKASDGGAVLFMGHWDHLGICRPEGEPDRICNGAIDNASGLAVLSEIGRQLARKKHDRDIYFMATTAEESGLLGAQAFANDPFIPLDKIIIALNIDTIAVGPPGAKLAVIGRGTPTVEGEIDKLAVKAKRQIDASSDADAFLQRQDGWVLTQKGVPALMLGGAFANLALIEQFLEGSYHGPGDELNDKTELRGAAQDASFHVLLGQHFASKKKYKSHSDTKKAGD